MESRVDLPHTSGRLLIRDFAPHDRDFLMRFTREPSRLAYMMFSLDTEEEVDGFLEFTRTQAVRERRDEWHFALEETASPGCIGGVALRMNDEEPDSAELGYWLERSARGKGYATEASRFMLDFGFRSLGLHRIWGKCHVDNRGSARVMEKLGMQLEGTVREHVWLRDHYRSSYLYSILEHEWRDRQGA
ncbi:MAG: GNAT family N-acetyltransferase [Spirochaetota bacterium]